MASDKEVTIISGGTHNVEPPGLQAMALSDTVPPNDPEIPFEDFRSFLVAFDKGSISPFLVMQDGRTGTGQTVVSPSPDGYTSIEAVLPAAFDATDWTALSGPILEQKSAAFAARILFRADNPAPAAGQDFQLFFLMVSPLTAGPDIVGIFHSQAMGFVFFAQLGASVFTALLAPFVQGSEYDFRWQSRPMTLGRTCVSIVAKQNGVVVADTSAVVPEQARFSMLPAQAVHGVSNVPGAAFKITMKEFAVGYQPLATPIGGCP